MSLAAIPSDILLNIFKRLDAATIDNLSKVNKQCHEIIKKKKLFRPVADNIRISALQEKSKRGIVSVAVEIEAIVICNGISKTETENCRFNDAIDKIVLCNTIKELHLSGTRSLVVIGEVPELYELLMSAGIDLRKARSRRPVPQPPPPLDNPYDTKNYFSSLAKYKCKRPPTYAFMNDEFLEKLTATPKPRDIDFENCFTKFTLEKMIDVLMKASRSSKHFTWDLGIIGPVCRREVDKCENLMKSTFIGECSITQDANLLYQTRESSTVCIKEKKHTFKFVLLTRF